jgi:MoaA/NifB/PqqE/SkfB family radical SAM enzyme
VFCPNEDVLRSGLPHGKMAPDLFRKIIDDLARTAPRRILLYLQNEPLNDTRMPEFVRYVAERLPDTTTLVTTNGTNLTQEMGERLIDAGLKRVKVSLQSLDDETNRAIMGYDATKVVNNVIGFKRLLKEKRSKLDLRVSMVVTGRNRDEVERARGFWGRHGVRLVTSVLENRGGNIKNALDLNDGQEMVTRANCIRPSREMCILYNGEVVLCCVDWFRTVTGGDVSRNSVQEVWNSPAFLRIREGFSEGDASKLPEICINCTESACPDGHRRTGKALWRRFKGALLGPFKADLSR